MTVADRIRIATQQLSGVSDTARLDAELLMAHALRASRSELLLRHMAGEAPELFDTLLRRRQSHEPVAYITGEQEFYSLPFRVTPDTLIPRSDSETLVEAALELAGDARRVLDLGTGSGALLIATLSELSLASGVGTDKSAGAIAVARDNAGRLGISPDRIDFLESDWSMPGWSDGFGTFDLILCNPPYVEDAAQLEAQVQDFEPAGALFSGPEGLDDYRMLIPQLRRMMSQGGVAILEIGASQGDAVRDLAQAHDFTCEIRHDLANRPRAVVLR